MTEAKYVMDDFMNKLNNDLFKKDNLPNNGPNMTEEFVNKIVREYSEILDLKIIETALSE